MDSSPEVKESSSKPYRLGIALSGGGARGFAHAGALKAFEEAGHRPEIIAGVSAGAVIAVMYAAGVQPEKMVEIFSHGSFRDFTELKLRGGGLFKIKKFTDHILKHIEPYSHLEDLPLRTFIGVTNFDTGQPEVFSSGEIGPRMTASCSIPIIFQPVRIEGTNYVDGGVVKNLPAWTIRDLCDTLVGINVSPMNKRPATGSMLDVATRTFAMMSKSNMREDLRMCDHLIELNEISAYRTFNLKEINKVFMAGYLNARHALKSAGLWNSEGKADASPTP